MGTRNLTVVYSNGEYKVAQYGQFDGYPEYLGVQLLAYLKGINREILETSIDKCSYLSKAELEMLDKSIKSALEDNSHFEWQRFYPELSNSTGGDILGAIVFKHKNKLKNSLEFAANSLYCEWAYVIDLDKNTFEIYKGFNSIPLTDKDRFYFLMEEAEKIIKERKRLAIKPDRIDTYYPVKKIKEYDLNNLPDKEKFVEEIDSIIKGETQDI